MTVHVRACVFIKCVCVSVFLQTEFSRLVAYAPARKRCLLPRVLPTLLFFLCVYVCVCGHTASSTTSTSLL